MSKFATILHPTEKPYRGLGSKPHLTTLPDGVYSIAKNERHEEDLPRVRWPMTRSGTDVTGAAITGPYMGAWTGYLNGLSKTVVASRQSGQIYSVSSNGTHAEISGTTGIKYLNTRLSTSQKMVSFAPVKDARTGLEYLVIQDGVNSPRVWNPNETDSGEKVAINAAITPPSVLPAFNVVNTFPKTYTIYDASTTGAPSNSGANFTMADAGASTTNNYIIVTIAAAVAAGDNTTQALASAAKDLSACPQLVLYLESPASTTANFNAQSWIDHIQVELVDSTGNTVIWNPAASPQTIRKPFKVDITTTGKVMVIYDINWVGSTLRDAVTALKFTYRGSSPSNAKTVWLNGVFGSGKIQGQATYTLSYLNQGSRAESPGIQYASENTNGEYFKNLGCRQDQEIALPNDYRVFYQHNIPYQNPTQAQLEAGVDAIVIYRSDFGEDIGQDTYVATDQIGAYSVGAWALDSGTYSSVVTYSDNADVGTKDLNIAAPDRDCLTIPIGLWMASASDRLFVLSYEAAGGYQTPSYSALWASETGSFSRMYRSHKSEDSGTRNALQGEIGICLKAFPTSVYGVSTMLLWTNKALYRFSPTQATFINQLERIAPYGTWTPYSVASSEDSVYWVDQNRIVRRYNGNSIEDISSQTIQDKLLAVGSQAWETLDQSNGVSFFGCFWNQRYYLNCDQSGTSIWTNTENPLVYETRRNHSGDEYGWGEDTLGASTYSSRFMINLGSYLYVFSKDGFRYRYEDPYDETHVGTELPLGRDGYSYAPVVTGTGYTATLKTGAFFPGLRGEKNGIVVLNSDVMCDEPLSGTKLVDYTYNYLPGASAPTQQASTDGSTAVVWVRPSTPPTSTTEGFGAAVSIQAVFSAGCAGMRLYGWRIEYEEREYRPQAS